MIHFELLTKDDYAVLFEGFETSFLQIPLKHPSKALLRFVPNGFRAQKLKRQQLVKFYVDAIAGGESSITAFIETEIEQQFERAGITEYVSAFKDKPEILRGVGIAEITVLLLRNGLHIPAYIVLLLLGYTCPDTIREISTSLFCEFNKKMKEHGDERYNEGISDGGANTGAIQEEAEKRISKLEKSIAAAEKKRKEYEQKLESVANERDEALLRANSFQDRLRESEDALGRSEKSVTQLTHDSEIQEGLLREKDSTIELLNGQIRQYESLDAQLAQLRSELATAKEMAYSDGVLKRLCKDVIDELTATSLGKQEVLRIAKERFSASETILAGWQQLSDESNQVVDVIVRDFDKGVFSEAQLDQLESLEDGILIRYAITKSLKAILYDALEKQEAKTTIGERFGSND